MEKQLGLFESFQKDINLKKNSKVVNVASVPQRSPFRYPGGKTWLVPSARKWLKSISGKKKKLIEPFCGGAIISLTAVFENLVEGAVLVELDREVAAVWETILSDDNEWLAAKIENYSLTKENADKEFSKKNLQTRDLAFNTILKNRIFHGGILADGSGMIKNGENGKGLQSRWYPQTLAKRIRAIDFFNPRLEFINGDGLLTIEKNMNNPNVCFFIDPPYVKAGKRLYKHFEMDHDRLFFLVSKIQGDYMMTYDDNPEVIRLIEKYKLSFRKLPMSTTHHIEKFEIIICNDFDWWQ